MKPTISTITDNWIKQNNPCKEAVENWWDKKERNSLKILSLLIKDKKYDWANWFIVRVMEYKDYVTYAIFAAEQIIDIYEEKYPNDKRPRKAIEAAKKCIEDPSDKNKTAAYAAHVAAYAAAYTAHAAADAAYAAAYTAAHVAAYAADVAAYAAADAAAYTAHAMKLKILEYGMELLKAGEK